MPGYQVQPTQVLEVFVTRIGAQEIIAAATPQGQQLIRLSLISLLQPFKGLFLVAQKRILIGDISGIDQRTLAPLF
jgi:hypothetical protein